MKAQKGKASESKPQGKAKPAAPGVAAMGKLLQSRVQVPGKVKGK